MQGAAVLAGHFSTAVNEEGAHERLRRSGFCGMSSKVWLCLLSLLDTAWWLSSQ